MRKVPVSRERACRPRTELVYRNFVLKTGKKKNKQQQLNIEWLKIVFFLGYIAFTNPNHLILGPIPYPFPEKNSLFHSNNRISKNALMITLPFDGFN